MNKKAGILLLCCLFTLTACGSPRGGEPAGTEPEKEYISLLALGDNLLHMPVVNSGKQEDGTYTYGHLFQELQPQIRRADLAVIGQETIFAGKEAGYSGYPMFNSPSDMGRSLVEEGFDIVLHASNHVMDRGTSGIEKTLAFWAQYPQVTVLGIHESQEAKETVTIREVKGAKLALLNYTYGTNGIHIPKEKAYLVSEINEEKIEQDVAYGEENADFTVAFMHWGTEYSLKPDENQKALARKMCAWGVDLIIGSHPHVIEPVEWIEAENGNKMLVYYSLGNFVSRQLEAKNLLGAMAEVELLYDGETVSISHYAFTPIVTHYDTTYKKFTVLPLSAYTEELANTHGVKHHDGAVPKKRYYDLVMKVFSGYDLSPLESSGFVPQTE